MALIAVPLVITGAAVGSFALLNAWYEIEEVYDAELAHAAKLLLQLTEHELDEHKKDEIELGIEDSKATHPYEKNIAFRIWEDNLLVTQSVSAHGFDSFRAPPGFSNHTLNGERWRFFVYFGEHSNITVEVAEKQDVRMDITLDLAESLIVPFSLFVPILLFLIWLGTTKSLQPLSLLSVAVDRRDIDDLSPLRAPLIPREITPLVGALNKLFVRMEESIRREREFTDNAAHELRTPLAAMKTQAQVLLKKTTENAEKEGLENLVASIDRAVRLVEQLLSFARLQSKDMPFAVVDFSTLVDEVVTEFSPLAKAKGQALTADVPRGIRLKGNKDALQIMLRNLIDNAIKFTPDKGDIRVSLAMHNGQVILDVSDTGPGVSDDQKDKIFDRFYRVSKSKTQGSGLGLAMVKWICDSHKARIEIRNNTPAGLSIQVFGFPQ